MRKITKCNIKKPNKTRNNLELSKGDQEFDIGGLNVGIINVMKVYL